MSKNISVEQLLKDIFSQDNNRKRKMPLKYARSHSQDRIVKSAVTKDVFSSALISDNIRDFVIHETFLSHYHSGLHNFSLRNFFLEKGKDVEELVTKIRKIVKTKKYKSCSESNSLLIYDKKPASFIIVVPWSATGHSNSCICLWSDEGEEELEETFETIFGGLTKHDNTKALTEFIMEGGQITDVTHRLDLRTTPTIYKELYPDLDIDLLVADYYSSNESLLILYGDPGTGKTSLIKKLVYSETIKDCAYIKDPRVLSETKVWSSRRTFDLLVFDDLDGDMIAPRNKSPDAKRFLNNLLSYSDGIINSIIRPKIAISSNQNLEEIDSALIRAGRCFDFIHLVPLTYSKGLELWVDFFKADAKIYTSKFKGLTHVTQAQIMSELQRVRSNKTVRHYMAEGNRNYSIESKLNELGIKSNTPIHGKIKAGFA